jgi:NADH:ubiquinone reductase (non-electrogenic)
MALTPLLASAACGIFDFRIAEEPVRRLSNEIVKYQVEVKRVDLQRRTIRCRPTIGSNGDARPASDDSLGADEEGEFEVRYDKLILSPGGETNTFGTPGVLEHCYMMKSVADATKLRERMLDCFELASLPTFSEEQKRDILHFVIIGAGPTGVELAAEIDELVEQHLGHAYKDVMGYVTVSVYDVADKMLGMFGDKLGEYAMEKFRRRDVKMCMGRHIEGFEKGVMKVKEDGRVGFGVAVWAAGNKACSLVEGLDVRKTKEGMERVLTDRHLRVLRCSSSPSSQQPDQTIKDDIVTNVYALGDAADILEHQLPATAEVAVQKARWLAKYISTGELEEAKPFEYQQKALVAYIGRGDGVVEGKHDWTGTSAWLAWRSGSLEWTRSWRRRVMIVLVWVMNKLDGREIARR